MTLRGETLYIHLPVNTPGEGLFLRPLSLAPLRVTLLNDGRHLPFAVEYLPSFFSGDKPYAHPAFLHIREIPVNEITDEPLILKLEFASNGSVRTMLQEDKAEAVIL